MHIRTRFDKHMQKMRTKVQNITDEEFTTVVGAVNTTIAEKDKNIVEDFTRMWSEMASHDYKFDRQA